MSNLVIVAIPDENDRVWKVSSEKIPHLTVLFLGDVDEVSNLDQIMLFVEHAANTTLKRFYMPVDRRGELGEDKADVLFFKKGRYDYKAIRDFRAQLLKDDNIRTAYDSATQFEGPWNPHLTLGYPTAPAKPDDSDRDYGFYEVCFNKIAVWTGDFEGPDFLLKDFWDEWDAMETVPMDVAWSSMNQARVTAGMEAIDHSGVKGMKWGVRKEDVDRAASSSKSSFGKAVSEVSKFAGDIQFESRTRPSTDEHGGQSDSPAKEKVVDEAHKPFKQDLSAINSKPEYVQARKLTHRLLSPFDKTTKAYRKEVKAAYIKRLEATANSMKNPSGTREYSIRERGGDLPKSKWQWEVSTREARHAEGNDFVLVDVLTDEDGFVTGTKIAEDSIAQTMELGEAFLAHYGVRGMKWGVRKEEARASLKGVGETKRGGIQKFLDPQGHDLRKDVAKVAVSTIIPPLKLVTWPAEIRMYRGAFRGIKAKALDSQEKKFVKNAMSPKNFVAIHNGAIDKVNRDIDGLNKKYPDLSKPATKKKYDAAVLKSMQDGYKASANSLTNKAQTHHLDVEFVNDGQDFKIHARKGAPTPLPIPERVKHAADDEDEIVTVEITGKIKRDATGHIVGFEFDHLEQASAAHSAVDVGEAFILEHYGIKGMRWGVRTQRDVTAESHADTGVFKRRTKIQTTGGEAHDAHPDAVKSAVAKQKVKKSGTDALSTQELRDLANRLNVENQVSVLMSSKGKQFVSRQFESEAKNLAKVGFKVGPGAARAAAPKVAKAAKRSAATIGVAAALL